MDEMDEKEITFGQLLQARWMPHGEKNQEVNFVQIKYPLYHWKAFKKNLKNKKYKYK